jgi:hypothetical protein
VNGIQHGSGFSKLGKISKQLGKELPIPTIITNENVKSRPVGLVIPITES